MADNVSELMMLEEQPEPPAKKQRTGGAGIISLGLDVNTGGSLTVDLPVHIVEKYHPDNGGKTVCYKDLEAAIQDVSQIKDDHEIKVIVIHQGRPTQLIIVFSKPVEGYPAGDDNQTWIAQTPIDSEFHVLQALRDKVDPSLPLCVGCQQPASVLLTVTLSENSATFIDEITRRRMWLAVTRDVKPSEASAGICEKCDKDSEAFYGAAREQFFINPETLAAASNARDATQYSTANTILYVKQLAAPITECNESIFTKTDEPSLASLTPEVFHSELIKMAPSFHEFVRGMADCTGDTCKKETEVAIAAMLLTSLNPKINAWQLRNTIIYTKHKTPANVLGMLQREKLTLPKRLVKSIGYSRSFVSQLFDKYSVPKIIEGGHEAVQIDELEPMVDSVAPGAGREVALDKALCLHCGYIPPARNLALLQKHIQVVHQDNVCKKCDFATSKGSAFRQHSMYHWPNTSKCDACQYGFKSPGALALHKPICTALPSLIMCAMCDHVERKAITLMDHVQQHTVSSENLSYFCPKCFAPFISLKGLEAHLTEDHEEEAMCCPHCGEGAINWYYLRDHIFIEHDEEFRTNPYPNIAQGTKCKYCAQWLIEEKDLKAHQAKHIKDKWHICEKCKITFKGVKAGKSCNCGKAPMISARPIPADEEDEKVSTDVNYGLVVSGKFSTAEDEQYVCYTCEVVTGDRDEINEHDLMSHVTSFTPSVDRVEEDSNSAYPSQVKKCAHCDFVCISKIDLLNHQGKEHPDQVHPSLEKVSCPHCPYIASQRSIAALNAHIDTYHTQKESNRCSTCDYYAQNVYFKQRHEAYHEEDSFKCETCQLGFAHPSKLQDHRTSRCSNLPKVMLCPFCDHTTRTSRQMCDHQRVHSYTGEAVYCPVCHSAFATTVGLEKHVTRQHGEELIKCQFCEECTDTFYPLRDHVFMRHKENSNPESMFAFRGSGEKCRFCSARFEDEALLQEHQEKHEADGWYYCNECVITYMTGKSHLCRITPAATRQKIVIPPDAERYERVEATGLYKCKLCPFTKNSEDTVSNHSKQHYPQGYGLANYKELRCTLCMCPLYGNSNVKVHMLEVHGQRVDSYRPAKRGGGPSLMPHCDKCDAFFKTTEALNAHNDLLHPRPHKQEEDDPALLIYQCSHCSMRCKSIKGLQFHMKSHGLPGSAVIVPDRTVERPRMYACEICDKKCLSLNGVREHMRIKHDYFVKDPSLEDRDPNAYPFQCTECSKRFIRRATLSCHMTKVHRNPNSRRPRPVTGSDRKDPVLYPFQCDTCKIRCKTPKGLNEHIRLTHERAAKTMAEINPERTTNIHVQFKCSDCSKLFSSKFACLQHKRTCMAVDPNTRPLAGKVEYRCSNCHQMFADVMSLQRHAQFCGNAVPQVVDMEDNRALDILQQVMEGNM